MKKIILICFCCGFLVSPALAQQQDSIAKAREEANALDAAMRKRSEEDSAYQVKFNALRYSMQKRFRPSGVKFANESFFDNFFVGLWGGYNRIIPRAGVDLTGGAEVGLSLTKFLTPATGLRLSGSWMSANRKSDNEKWSSYSMTADHLFNLASAIGGYNPNRTFEVMTVAGFGYHLSSLAGKKKSAGDFHMGLNLKLNTGTRLDIFAEPRLSFYTDGIDLSSEQNWHKYDAGLSMMFGFNYRLGTFYKHGTNERSEESFMENTFISAGMGLQFQNSALVRQQGIMGSMGPMFHLSVGKWFLDPFGLRLTAFGSNNSWKRQEDGNMDYMTMYAGGRGEVMINPIAFFNKDVHDMRWGIIPMFGVEMGVMKKQDTKGLISKTYAGWTGGLQFKYYVSNNFAFYLEPRMSRVPYSFTERTTSGKVNEFSFYDNVFNASIGIELRRPTRSEWRELAASKDGFQPYFFAQVGAGVASPLQLYRSASRRPGYMLGAALGRQFTPISGVRVGLDVNNASVYTYGVNTLGEPNKTLNRYTFTNFSLNYMFDISNWVIGYDPNRKFGAEIFAGPVITKNFDPGKMYVGGDGGVRAYWKLLDQFDIYAEPRIRVYSQRYMPASRGAGTPFQLSMTMGTSYRFGNSFNRSLTTNFGDGTFWGNTFVSAAVGAQNIVKSNSGINPLVAAGPQFSLSIGKWLLPFWAIRASAFGGYSSWGRVKMDKTPVDRLTARFGGRVEAMFNVLAIGKDDWRESRWSLSPMLGLEFGKLMQQLPTESSSSVKKNYSGVTAALQAKYNVTDAIGIFVEPRLSRLPYTLAGTSSKGTNTRISAVDNVMSFNVGFEFRRASKENLSRNSNNDFMPYYFASFQTGGAMPMHKMRYTARKLGFLVGATAGRQFTPVSGARVGFDFSSTPGIGKKLDANSSINLSADYLFDISNFAGGYDPDNKFGVEALAGLVVSLGATPNKLAVGGEGGFRTYYKLPQDFDIYLEPKIRMYAKNQLYGSSATPLEMMLSLGMSYKF